MNKPFALRRIGIGLMTVMLLATAAIADSRWVKPTDVDFKTILPATAPSNDTPQAKAEIAQILALQASRDQVQVDRCKSEQDYNAFVFADPMGSWFKANNVPVTAEFMKQVDADTEAIVRETKKYYVRPRPFLVDPRIVPCVKLEKSYSFPSGHSTHGTVDAIILAQIMPDKEDRLKVRGEQVGDDRVLAGMHFPSDVAAGRLLGQAIAQKLLDNPDFTAELEKAKAECATHDREK